MGDSPILQTEREQPRPEMAHVLFMDVVGYTKLLSDVQSRVVQQLRLAVRGSSGYKQAKEEASLICIPTGDGMALVFFANDVCAPIRTALEVTAALRAEATFGLRMGLHSGTVFRVPDINGTESIAGAGINIAQRVMDCADAGHILVSEVHASFLREFESLQPHLHEIGEAEVKHGLRVALVNYWDGNAGRAALPERLTAGKKDAAVAEPKNGAPSIRSGRRVALIYRRGIELDETLLGALEAALGERGFEVFIDRHLRVGLNWAREIERTLRAADAVIPLLSPEAVQSEMLTYELELSDEAAQQQQGRPRLLPVRVNWEGPLPEGISKIVDPLQYALWRGPEDTAAVVAELPAALSRTRLVWGLDELDRLFSTSYCSEVCGLFRSWHNARASDPEGPWGKLTQILCYATEAHLLIPDLNQSPFNVGVRIPLQDFSDVEVRRLNQIYDSPLHDGEIAPFQALLGGQPYLVRRGLNELVAHKQRLAELVAVADQDEGPFRIISNASSS